MVRCCWTELVSKSLGAWHVGHAGLAGLVHQCSPCAGTWHLLIGSVHAMPGHPAAQVDCHGVVTHAACRLPAADCRLCVPLHAGLQGLPARPVRQGAHHSKGRQDARSGGGRQQVACAAAAGTGTLKRRRNSCGCVPVRLLVWYPCWMRHVPIDPSVLHSCFV